MSRPRPVVEARDPLAEEVRAEPLHTTHEDVRLKLDYERANCEPESVRSHSVVRVQTWAVSLAALLAVTSGPATAAEEDAPPKAEAPSILLVVLDACRADRLSPYGFERATTPTLAEVADDPNAVIFERHYVQAPWTKPSTASLFTGLPVSRHKVYRGHTRAVERNAPESFVTDRLSEERQTMAERMKEAGLSTFAVVWGRQLEPEYGFAQGFDEYFTHDVKTDRDRLAKVFELIDASERPFFGYVHFEGCHLPFPKRDRHKGYMAEHALPYNENARRAEGVNFGAGTLVFDINQGGLSLTEQDAAFLDLTYQAKTRRMDEEIIRPLVDGLRERALDDELLLLFTADHGEELYEHGKYGHSQALWDEIVHVPLIVRFPKGKKPDSLTKSVDAPTQAIGLLPSLIDVVGLPADQTLPGANLLAGETPSHVVAEMSPIWGARGYAIVAGDYKLLHIGGGNVLSNLATDPGEKTNLAAKEAARAAMLSAKALELKRHFTDMQAAAPLVDVELDPKAVEQLRALGYME